jgi:hypothetical protein
MGNPKDSAVHFDDPHSDGHAQGVMFIPVTEGQTARFTRGKRLYKL